MVPLTILGRFLLSPEGLALIGAASAWLLRRDFMASSRARAIADAAGVVFDGMEGWAKYRRSIGEPVSGQDKLEKYLELVGLAVKSRGVSSLSPAERLSLAASAEVRAWIDKGDRAPALVSKGKK